MSSMPKRSADGLGGGLAALRPCRRRLLQKKQQHLYLVLDDWERGYSIRKVDLDADSDDDHRDQSHEHQRLPPAVFRLEAPHADSALFASFGTKIIATHSTRRRDVPVFDVRSRALNFGPRHKTQPNTACAIYVEAAGRLFLMDQTSFEALGQPPPPPSRRDYIVYGGLKPNWKWRDFPSHVDNLVVAHAVHPDGRTLFFSTAKHTTKRRKFGTFSFDTARSAWARHGAWRLPFEGCGFFDRNLDAWVGLSGDPDSPATLGHLCASQVVVPTDDDAADGQQQRPPPPWKLSKERLFCTDPAEKHIGATLVYMGNGSRFCVVQRLSIGKGKNKEHLLRLTTVFLKYDMNGDLRVGTYGRVRYYRLSEIATWYRDLVKNPVAFWM